MAHPSLIGKTFAGYTLREIVATGPEEVLFVAERSRDGEPVWLRTAREREDTSIRKGFADRYEGERMAARKLGSMGVLLPVREVIDVDGVPGLVTDVPRGRSLNDVFVSSKKTPDLADVLPWFRPVMQAMEAAHDEGTAHGSLSGRAVYLADDGRITICGLAVMTGDTGSAARRADVRSLAGLMYTASCGRPPKRGFPDTGLPVSPEEYVEDYPSSLARFLVRRLGDVDDDPVEDAGVFRRSIDALSVDPEFRKAAGLSDRKVAAASDVIVERSDRKAWRRLALLMGGGGTVIALSVLVTILVMEVRVEEARRQGATSVAPAPTQTVVARPDHPRLAAWECLHQHHISAEAGPMAPHSLEACLQLAPQISIADLRAEVELLSAGLGSTPNTDDQAASLNLGYERMFDQGADAVEQHITYRLKRQLSTAGVEAWIQTNPAAGTTAVLKTLARRNGDISAWSKRALSGLGGGQ